MTTPKMNRNHSIFPKMIKKIKQIITINKKILSAS